MNTKYMVIAKYVENSVRDFTGSKEKWMRYLDTAARLYKYPFSEQMLIHAQRPDATACASFETWNEKMSCRVNRGAKGIALPDLESGRPRLKYVFDMADVHAVGRTGRFPRLWKLGEEHKKPVLEALEKLFGGTNPETTFEDRLVETAERLTLECYEDFLQDFYYAREGSILEEMDELNADLCLRETLSSSIAYTLLSRCGADMSFWKDELHFDYIHEFDTLKVLTVLGNATTEMCEDILMEIGRTIREYDRRAEKEAQWNAVIKMAVGEPSKKEEKGIANGPETHYNALKRESEKGYEEKIREGIKHGTDIRESRRLSAAEPAAQRGTGGAADKVRTDAEELPEGTPGRALSGHDTGRGAEGALSGNPETGRTEDGHPDRADGESRGSGRGAESVRSDEMGGDAEQHQTLSGGDRTGGADLRIESGKEPDDRTQEPDSGENSLSGSFSGEGKTKETETDVYEQLDLFTMFSEQLGSIRADQAEEKSSMQPMTAMPKEQLAEILRTGGGREDSRKRIYAGYQQGRTPEEMAEFLKKEYGTTGKGFLFDGRKVAVWFNPEGMAAGYGLSAQEYPAVTMGWQEIEAEVRSQVEGGTYMDAAEVYLVDEAERDRIANRIFFFFRDGMQEMPEELGISSANHPESIAKLMEMLSSKSGIDAVAACIDRAIQGLETGERRLWTRFIYTPQELREELADLLRDRKEYPVQDVVEIRKEDFITQDEIDYVLCRGSGIQDGIFRIYDYFMEEHDSREAAAFLKKEYGIGGRSSALAGSDCSWENHDGKGISLEKGDITKPYTKVHLSWRMAEKRIWELIAADKYLTPEKKAAYEEYKEKQTEREEFGYPQAEEANYTPLKPDVIIPAEPAVKKIDKSGAANFHITEDAPGTNGAGEKTGFLPKEKFRKNVEAICTLKKIEEENRIATPKEQQVLSQYVGWGGLADAFDESKSAWAGEYQELKSLLSPEEYASARESTLNAHYTSPVIIRSIYETLNRMGFEKGNILEPALGIGNFFGMLPEKMQESRLYGVELDGLTGRIAKQLYPKAEIKISGFEKTDYPNDFFDAAVGNVPFGQYKVPDRQYDKSNFRGTGFLIHDYFFAKALDKVRPGGVVAFITSKGTMDKKNPEVRKYLAQRADLLGAVRLPNTAFKDNAGTEVTSDILFLKKRDRFIDLEPEWVHLSEDENGIIMNSYFVEHPEMILGKMEMVSGPYGMESTCQPDLSRPFAEQLRAAASRIDGQIEEAEIDELADGPAEDVIPADPNVKNYSYTLVNSRLYYRENSVMKPVDLSSPMQERIKGMVEIRDCTQELINFQLNEYPEDMIKNKQTELNQLYDSFSGKYGLISSKTNKRAFDQDAGYCLLCSLEKTEKEGKFTGKADMFFKRTIKKAEVVTSVDTAGEALAVSLSEKARVDIAYMAELAGKDADTIIEELTGVIFQNPRTGRWETADEYLSGNVREKLEKAKVYAENYPEYTVNVQALMQVQPKELDASEIEVRLGATWIEPEYIEDFMHETFETPPHLFNRNIVGVLFSEITGQWNVKGKNADPGNSLVNMTYGTSRRNAYTILEDSLNLRDSRVYDIVEEDGKEKRVLNKKETTIAAQKQEAIREAFKDWIFREPQRRQYLVEKYNRIFNSRRPREYDGEHLKFPGMTPDIELKPHQKNAVAHVLYGDNTLLAHCVGAGKTFEMTAAAMESRRLGLCRKSLFVVPNHLTGQWASDFLRLYPGANILAATKKDFEPANRKKFCSRIATGDYDAVIIGHSQFEKIPISRERQEALIEGQIDEIEIAIMQAKAENGERYTIKQMEKTKKSLQTRLKKLNDTARKDNVVTFEQLGVDRLFVDESHNYKNLFLYTKMRNVAGISQTEAQKSSDMFAKCRYLDEMTGGKGVTFATGTPISNSMTELYSNMRYLQYDTLQRLGLGHFDSWASAFGETQTAIELAPEGTGYRVKTRFAKFFNLPELIALFKESADIQTADMLDLPVPEAEYENVVLKPSEYQKDIVALLAERAEAVRNGLVEPNKDNMLKITNDGRKLALDQRLINEMLPDEENSKAAACVERAFEIWEQRKEQKSAQLIFCDLSTPKRDGTFNVYGDIKGKLIEKGVPPEEIAFIHEANTELRKAELFGRVRSGQIRFLLGSTQKMGAGTNVQDRLIALHHLDVPWRPSDIEQQEGRILRQGNSNEKVKIFRYVTEGTFDSYSWQVIENKQKFISQIMSSKSPVRSCDDVDEVALTYAEVKALATGNPYIKEKMDLDIQVTRLKIMKGNHTSQMYKLEDNITKNYPQKIAMLKERVNGLQTDIRTAEENHLGDKEQFSMKVGEKLYSDKKEAGTALVEMCRGIKSFTAPAKIGEYAGFMMAVSFDGWEQKYVMSLKGQLSHKLELGTDLLGNISRINHTLESMTKKLAETETALENTERQLETAKAEVIKPFPQEEELREKVERLAELDALLNMDEKGNEGSVIADMSEGGDIEDFVDGGTLIYDRQQSEQSAVADNVLSYQIKSMERDAVAGKKQFQELKDITIFSKRTGQRMSLKERLAEIKERTGDKKTAPVKIKDKEEVL